MFHVKHPASLATSGPVAASNVSRETLERLSVFLDLLKRWNGTVNLVSSRDLANIWPRHIADALQLIPLIPSGTDRLIDLGSGAGFPGLVLAIAANIRADLVEADERKAAFLKEAARAVAAPATVHGSRIENTRLDPAALVTARALAPLPTLLHLAAPLLTPGGVCLFPKGRRVEDELTSAAALWHMQIERFPSATDPTASILRLSEVRHG